MVKLILVFLFVASSYADHDLELKSFLPWKWGKCLKPEGVVDFQPDRFFRNHWFEHSSFGNFFLQGDGICTTVELKYHGEGVVDVLYYQYQPMLNKYMQLRSTVNQTQVVGSKFELEYDYWAGLQNVKFPFTVLGTDYENFSVIYFCEEAFGFKAEMSWLLTRVRGDRSHDYILAKSVANNGLKFSDYIVQKSTDCGSNEPHLSNY